MTPPKQNVYLRGEIWLANLDPTLGHEQSGFRPVLILSDNAFNQGLAGLTIVVPITSKERFVRSHVEILPPEGGLSLRSFIKCEDIRSISTERFIKRLGVVTAKTLHETELRLRYLLAMK